VVVTSAQERMVGGRTCVLASSSFRVVEPFRVTILRIRNSGGLQAGPGKKEPFDFNKSWVSALTTAGAFLGTALTAGVLPTDTFFISKAQYTALNVLFGLIIVVAVLIHNAGTKRSTLVFAAALTLGSACGELVTVLFVFREMAIQETMPLGYRVVHSVAPDRSIYRFDGCRHPTGY
jgi:hypothetical protein